MSLPLDRITVPPTSDIATLRNLLEAAQKGLRQSAITTSTITAALKSVEVLKGRLRDLISTSSIHGASADIQPDVGTRFSFEKRGGLTKTGALGKVLYLCIYVWTELK